MTKSILLTLLLALVLSVSSGCGFPNDPMLDDAYTRNIYLGDHTLERELDDGSGGYWHEYLIPAVNLSSGGSGATLIIPDNSTLGGYQLDRDTEFLFFITHIEDDWDEVSNAIMEIDFEVNVDNTGGNDTDTVKFQVDCYHKIEGEFANTTQSLSGNTVVGKANQYELFKQTITITNVRLEETVAVKLNLDTTNSEVDDIIVNFVELKYQAKTPALETP